MPYATLIEHVEHCGECVYSGYRNFYENGTKLVCGKLSQEETMPFEYAPCARGKNVRDDCPLPTESPAAAPPPPSRRPLSSLTEGEAKEVYRLAHAEPVSDPPFIDIADDCVRIGHGSRHNKWVHFDGGLELYSTGEMHCYIKVDTGECDVEKSEAFNAVAVVRFLDSIGIIL